MCHFCKNDKKNNTFLCPFSHDIQKEFRIIYDYKNEEICKFLNFIYNNSLFSFTNYFNYIPINPSIFDPNTFKVLQCPFDKSCKDIQDRHLCPFYHSLEEKRRLPLLFRYKIDDRCFDKEEKKYKVEKCQYGIFCNGIHSQNEYQYHPHKFRKEVVCTKSKENGHCIFIKSCYGIHPKEEYQKYKEEDIEERVKNEYLDIQALINKKKSINNISEYFKCRNCNGIPQKGKIKFLNECQHFLCKECFEKIYEDGDKKCPFCKKNIPKKSVINFYFMKK